MKTPLVSIVINNYNYGCFLSEAIESALEQTYSNLEVIVVDDGSTDNSREIIAQYAEKGKVIPVFKENGGQGSAFNAGFKASRGELVLFLDADDVLLPQCVAKVMEVWEPHLAKVQWRMGLVDKRKKPLGRTWPPARQQMVSGDLRELVFRWSSYPTPPTSGNAFSRWLLQGALPMPEEEWRIDADSYLLVLAPVRGRIRSIDLVLSLYRVHGKNAWFEEEGELGRIERALRTDYKKETLLHAEAQRVGWNGKIGAPPSALKKRLAFCLGLPGQVEEFTCSRVRLAIEGVLASIAYPFSPRNPLAKVSQILWFVLVPLLPNPWARRLVQLALAPARRPPWLSGLLGLDGGRAKRNES